MTIVSRARGGKDNRRVLTLSACSRSYPVFTYVTFIGSFQPVGRGLQPNRRTTRYSIGPLDYRPCDRPSVYDYGRIHRSSGSVGLSRISRTQARTRERHAVSTASKTRPTTSPLSVTEVDIYGYPAPIISIISRMYKREHYQLLSERSQRIFKMQ